MLYSVHSRPLVYRGGVGVRGPSYMVGLSVVLPAWGLPLWLTLVGFCPLPDAWPGVGLPAWLTSVLWFCLGASHLWGPSFMVGFSGAWRRFPLPYCLFVLLEFALHEPVRWL